MRFFFILSALAFVWAAACPASGTYRFTPPRPPSENTPDIDEDLYALGRNLFTSKVEPSRKALPGLINIQKRRLSALQEQLPRSIQERVDLPSLAALLSPTEMAALEYYSVVRYKIGQNTGAGL